MITLAPALAAAQTGGGAGTGFPSGRLQQRRGRLRQQHGRQRHRRHRLGLEPRLDVRAVVGFLVRFLAGGEPVGSSSGSAPSTITNKADCQAGLSSHAWRRGPRRAARDESGG